MKRKATKERQQVIQMKVTARDKQILDNLRQNNRTLRDSDILRLALDQLAEKQGVLPDMAEVS